MGLSAPSAGRRLAPPPGSTAIVSSQCLFPGGAAAGARGRSLEGPRRDAPPRPQMATRRPSTAPAESRRAWTSMRWPFRLTRGSRGYLRSHSFAVIRAQNGRSEVRDRVWTKQRTAFDLSSAARSGLAVVLRSRGARATASCRASSSKAARALVERLSGACQRPRGTSSKHALHRGGTLTGSLAGGVVPAASMVAALPSRRGPRADGREPPNRGPDRETEHTDREHTHHTAT